MSLPEEFTTLFRGATSSIVIAGTNPLQPHLEQAGTFFADLLVLNPKLQLTILVESDSENFHQSLCLDHARAKKRATYATLTVHRNRILGRDTSDGLQGDIARGISSGIDVASVLSRVKVLQSNTRLPINVIVADSYVWCAVTTTTLPDVHSYFQVKEGESLWRDVFEMLQWWLNDAGGKIFLSEPGEELIQLYDKQGTPRGIFPRKCFYTTNYQRYSIWGFVFNRRGELLLHKRSAIAKDGAGLWDKSIGGHVDLGDSSTYVTAQRELVEELFLPEAEFSKYVRADLGDIVHFGDWNPVKRPERLFREAFAGLGKSDWVLFRATDEEGQPLTITRVSDRRVLEPGGQTAWKRTVFRSDVYMFIAPPGYLDDESQMTRLVGPAERSGAAEAHKLIAIADMRDWILESEAKGEDRSTFTDDLLYVNMSNRDLLEGFAAFVQFVA